MSKDSSQIYSPEARTKPVVLKGWLAVPPPWRKPPKDLDPCDRTAPEMSSASKRRGKFYVSSSQEGSSTERDCVNLALMLRRPVLVTGPPGIGKSSLAYHLAWSLELGEPLRWEINSRTTLGDGLYAYDAVGHLRAIQEGRDGQAVQTDIASFITLGPLGTALLPTEKPRVLLVDELDKASFDLPNDLLHVFEEGGFKIPELVRLGGKASVFPDDSRDASDRVSVGRGRVRTHHHPVVVITSNGERVFPEAFRRRCIELELEVPSETHMKAIVRQQLGEGAWEASEKYLDGRQPTDVVLQTLFAAQHGASKEMTTTLKRKKS